MLLLIFSWHGNLPKNSENETFSLFSLKGFWYLQMCTLFPTI